MRLYTGLFMFAIAAAAYVSGCGTEYPAPASIGFDSRDIVDGELASVKDKSVLIGVVARDAEGRDLEVDASAVEWESSDPEVLEARALGSAALITCLVDWFDTMPAPEGEAPPEGGADGGTDAGTAEPPHEPHAVLTVRYGGQSASVDTACVINAAGRWRVMVEGYPEQELSLDQNGRTLTYTGAGDTASGSIDGDTITVMQLGFTLTGTFTSPDDVTGTYAGPGGLSGAWTARRLP